MPAKPLTDDQKADAKRLLNAFRAFQNQRRLSGLPYSQDALAGVLGFGQSALNQYLHGRIPLNAKALLSFSDLMSVEPEVISPSLAKSESERSANWRRGPTDVDSSAQASKSLPERRVPDPAQPATSYVSTPEVNNSIPAALRVLGQALHGLAAMDRDAVGQYLALLARAPEEVEAVGDRVLAIIQANERSRKRRAGGS